MFKELFGKKRGKSSSAMIVVAAGSGSRMGTEVNKLLLEYEGHSILEYSLMACNAASEVDEIVVVTSESLMQNVSDIVKFCKIDKVKSIVRGGATRIDSVVKGMESISGDVAFVGIHDGARPFVSPQAIDDCFCAARAHGAAVLATPLVDTIKVRRGDDVVGELDRDELVAVQTPQVFDREIFDVAIAYAKEKGGNYTDDVSVYRLIKKSVKIVWGDRGNIKITYPEDLEGVRR